MVNVKNMKNIVNILLICFLFISSTQISVHAEGVNQIKDNGDGTVIVSLSNKVLKKASWLGGGIGAIASKLIPQSGVAATIGGLSLGYLCTVDEGNGVNIIVRTGQMIDVGLSQRFGSKKIFQNVVPYIESVKPQ